MLEVTVVLGILVSSVGFYFGLQNDVGWLFGASILVLAYSFVAAIRGGWFKRQPLPPARQATVEKVTPAGVPEADGFTMVMGILIVGGAVVFYLGLANKIDWLFGVGMLTLAYSMLAGVRGKFLR